MSPDPVSTPVDSAGITTPTHVPESNLTSDGTQVINPGKPVTVDLTPGPVEYAEPPPGQGTGRVIDPETLDNSAPAPTYGGGLLVNPLGTMAAIAKDLREGTFVGVPPGDVAKNFTMPEDKRIKFGLPYRLAVKGSAEAVATALYKAGETVNRSYKNGSLKDAILSTITACMHQLTKVIRPRSSYNLRISAARADTTDRLDHGFNIDVRFTEDPNATPADFESLRDFELFVIKQSEKVARDPSEEARVLANFHRMVQQIEEE